MSFLVRSVLTKLEGCSSRMARFSSIVAENDSRAEKSEPIISTTEVITAGEFYEKPKQVWLENLDTVKEKKLGLVNLHPDVFGAQPRIDILHQNIRWQRMYKYVVSRSFHFSITLAKPHRFFKLINRWIPVLREHENAS